MAATVLVPFAHRLRWSRVAALTGCVLPGAAVALVLGVPAGRPLPGLALLALALVAAAALTAAVLRSRIELSPGLLRSRKTAVRELRDDQVAAAVVRRIRDRDGTTAHDHLFLVGHDGATLLHMSSRWWTRDQIQEVARSARAPLEVQDQPVDLAELRRTVPQQLRWQDRHPLLRLLPIAAVSCATALVLVGLTSAAV